MLRRTSLAIVLLALAISLPAEETTHQDEVLNPSETLPGGDFTLHSSQGAFSLEQLRGNVVVLYFGYTKCPDVCPTTLSIIAQALNELSEAELKAVQAVFISVDPKRDDYQRLDEYVHYFHSDMIGITGSEAEVAEVAARYGVQFAEVALDGSGFGYGVDHSAITYLITPEGKLRFMFPHETPAFVILEAIRYLLTNKD